MTNERAIQILENLISINGDIIIGDEGREALEMAIRSLQQEQQEEPDKSLEEAAEDYEQTRQDTDARSDNEIVRRAFIAGAKWQYQKDRGEFAKIKAKTWCEGFDAHKEQMLKEAVECELVCIKDYLAAILPMKEFRWTVGDKVRIIVLKAEEE